jgi:SAM-dependent methyltransferase
MLHQLARFTAIAPLIDELGGGRALDVGSGSEGVASWLRGDWAVTAVDRSFAPIGAMRGPRADRPVHTVVGDARELPFADGEFDVVLALDVMEHIEPAARGRALSELVRTARRRVIVAGPAGDAALAADAGLAEGLRRRGLTPPGWLTEHEANGFPAPGDLREQLAGHGRLRLLGNENLRWHEWLFRFEFRRPGRWASQRLSRAIAAGLARGGPIGAAARALARAAEGPSRPPHYRTIAVLDLERA